MTVKVAHVSPQVGLGVFACRNFQVGEEIFREEPIAACQHAANKIGIVACAHCFRYFPAESQSIGIQNACDPERAINDPTGSRCACGERYCSSACLEAAKSSHHWALCVANEADDSPLVNFKLHALNVAGSGDTLILAAQLFASIFQKAQGDAERLAGMKRELLTFSHGRYSEIARSGEADDWTEWLNDTLSTSFTFLQRALIEKDRRFASLVSEFELFDRVLGIFERNNVDVATREVNPLRSMTHAKEEISRFMTDIWDEEEMGGTFEEGIEVGDFPEFHGTGLYPTISRLNHSCDFTARLDFDGRQGFCVATRDIKEGEQIFISYLGKRTMEIPTAERRAMLEDYGFVCTCSRCQG